MGDVISLGDCLRAERSIGVLSWHVVDFGDAVPLSELLQKQLAVGCAAERNQRDLHSLAAGSEWILQNRPNRIRKFKRVSFAATLVRQAEFNSALGIKQHAAETGLAVPPLLSSPIRDSLYPGQDRDIRLFNWMLLPAMWGPTTANALILEVNELSDKAIGHYFTCPTPTDDMLYLVAHRGNLRWAKPAAQTLPSEWRRWKESVPILYHHSACDGWGYLKTGASVMDAQWRKSTRCPDFDKIICTDVCVAGSETDMKNEDEAETTQWADLPILAEPISDARELAGRREWQSMLNLIAPSENAMSILPWIETPTVGNAGADKTSGGNEDVMGQELDEVLETWKEVDSQPEFELGISTVGDFHHEYITGFVTPCAWWWCGYSPTGREYE